MAAIYDADYNIITQGLQGCSRCDEAIQMARRMAAERQECVILNDDDGEWIVYLSPDRDCDFLGAGRS